MKKKIIMKINSCKELAHRIDHSKPKNMQCILCPRRLQTTHDDCAVRVQWFSSVIYEREHKILVLTALLSNGGSGETCTYLHLQHRHLTNWIRQCGRFYWRLLCIYGDSLWLSSKTITASTWPLLNNYHFLFLNKNICCGCSKESSQGDGSFEHPKQKLKLIDEKIFTILR